MPLVKTDCPLRRGPRADQQWAGSLVRKPGKQRATDSSALICRAHVCVAYQSDVANMLNSHDAGESACLIPAPKVDPGADLVVESGSGHVRVVPAICRNNP